MSEHGASNLHNPGSQELQSQKTQEELLAELHPVFRHKVELILTELTKLGWQPRIVFARRTQEQQRDAVRRGASPTTRSWHVPTTIGLMPAGAALQVIRGNAVDIVDRRYLWEGEARNQDFQFWKDLGAAAHKYDCQWGGDWKPKRWTDAAGKPHVRSQRDVAHVQMFFTEERTEDSVVV